MMNHDQPIDGQAVGSGALVRLPGCGEPELYRAVTDYCFGQVDEGERRRVEAHLLVCQACRGEVERLRSAVDVLRSDRVAVPDVTPREAAAAFGLSSRLERVWAGHAAFTLVSGAAYALIHAVTLFLEIAYAYDRYGAMAWRLAPCVFLWMLGTTAGGLALDWKLTRVGRRGGLAASFSVFGAAALVLYLAARWFLPDVPVTQASFQTATAQAAYLKSIGTALPLAWLFVVVPFHFIVALQRAMREGQYASVLALLAGHRLGVTPRGAVYVRVWTLAALLVVAVVGLFPGFSHLFDNLQSSPYLNLFSQMYYARWLIYYTLGLGCLIWYQRALNEVKRECLVAAR